MLAASRFGQVKLSERSHTCNVLRRSVSQPHCGCTVCNAMHSMQVEILHQGGKGRDILEALAQMLRPQHSGLRRRLLISLLAAGLPSPALKSV